MCDALRLHSGPLSAIRGATPAEQERTFARQPGARSEDGRALFWTMLEHRPQFHPGFGTRRRPKLAFRFKRLIHVVDSTTIQLVARCLDWAKHRRRQAYPVGLRRVVALIEVNGVRVLREMNRRERLAPVAFRRFLNCIVPP